MALLELKNLHVALPLGRQRLDQPADQVPVEHEADHERNRERAQAEEQPLPQLVEMLDEGRLLTVVQATRKPRPR